MQLFLNYKLLEERDPVEYLDRVRQGTAFWSLEVYHNQNGRMWQAKQNKRGAGKATTCAAHSVVTATSIAYSGYSPRMCVAYNCRDILDLIYKYG